MMSTCDSDYKLCLKEYMPPWRRSFLFSLCQPRDTFLQVYISFQSQPQKLLGLVLRTYLKNREMKGNPAVDGRIDRPVSRPEMID